MPNSSLVKLTIAFTNPDLDSEERDEAVHQLLQELNEMEEVESATRVVDPNPPEDTKSIGGFLVGMLTAEISIDNTKKLMGFLGDRLGGKPIELEVEADGRKLKVKASSREELDAAVQAAKQFLEQK